MDIEEGFRPTERAATISIACENRAAFRFPHRKTPLVETGLNPLSRFPAAFSERRGKSFVRKQPAEKITKVLASRSENAA
jgi:hypothetical protein